jgi:hypothetical protein
MLYEARELYLMDEMARRDAAVAEGKFKVARSMLARGMSVSDIADITGLNERDILSLQ